MALYKVTYHLMESNERKFDVIGTSTASAAQALAEADTKLALTVGTYLGGLVSSPPAVPGVPHAAEEYSDAIIVLRRGAAPNYFYTSVRLQNIANEYGVEGEIPAGQADIDAFAAAYHDGAGNGGWSFKSGRYVA